MLSSLGEVRAIIEVLRHDHKPAAPALESRLPDAGGRLAARNQ